jgi:ankyrin repeat protein
MAASNQHRDIAELLLNYGAVIEPDIAVMLGDIKLVKYYLDLGVNPNSKLSKGFSQGESWLLTATTIENLQLFQLLLNYGAQIETRIKSEQILPIHRASAIGCLAICQFLILNGMDVNTQSKHGKTCLHLAAQYGHEDIVKLLVESGANVNILDSDNCSPLFSAVQHYHYNIVEYLLLNNAEVNLIDRYGNFPLSLAFHKLDNERLIKLLINYGADINIRDGAGFSVLHKCVIQKNPTMVKFLLDLGIQEGLA